MKRHAFSYLRIHFSVVATRSPEGKLRRVHSSRTSPWCKYTSLWCSGILRRDIRYAPDTHSRLTDVNKKWRSHAKIERTIAKI